MNWIRLALAWWMVGAVWLLAAPAKASLTVVATTADLAAIARQIGGAEVQVSSLALATQDPHFVDPKPSLALVLNRADLLVVQGLDLEIGWLPTLLTGARNPKIMTGADGYLDASMVVQVLDAPTAPVTRAQGDIHRGGNPHYLYDPRNGARVARAVADRLGKLDPAHAAYYATNAESFEQATLALAQSLGGRFAELDPSRRKVVVYHRSWVYLEAWLGLFEVGAIEPKPGIPPDPGHVAGILGIMRGQKVRAILAEEYYPEVTAKLLADKSGARLLRMPGGPSSGQSYVDRVRDLADRVYSALSR